MTADQNGSHHSPYEEAAKRAVEAGPMPGENLATTHLEDADHWIRVYSELLDFKAAMINEMNRRVETMPREAVEEVERSDALVLIAERDRFRNRLDQWQRRRAELAH